jgi:hypothetical protein
MKVYSYTYQYDKIKREGYKSLALFDENSEYYKSSLWTHRHSAKSDNYDDIRAYLEHTFEGRLRSVCVVTETAPENNYKHPYLDHLVHYADVISFDLDQLLSDNIAEEIYCKDIRQSVLKDPGRENIYKINSISEIDMTPHDWHLCEQEEYRVFSPWATIKHYMLVLTEGYIPPEYIALEVNRSAARKNINNEDLS